MEALKHPVVRETEIMIMQWNEDANLDSESSLLKNLVTDRLTRFTVADEKNMRLMEPMKFRSESYNIIKEYNGTLPGKDI